MLPLKKALKSSIGKKYLMAMSGFALLGFLTTHLLANMLLYLPTGDMFNGYVQTLQGWGPGLYVAEAALAGLFLFHIVLAIALHSKKGEARGSKYAANVVSKGGESKFGLPANNMLVTGIVLAVFLVAHIIHLKFGAGIEEGYTTMLNGEETRDLYRLVVEQFSNPVVSVLYSAVILFLGFHIRHGFWSAFQSLGLMAPKYTKLIYALGLIIAGLFTVGFMGIPLWFLFDIPGVFK